MEQLWKTIIEIFILFLLLVSYHSYWY
jgi:hypothetical protein